MIFNLKKSIQKYTKDNPGIIFLLPITFFIIFFLVGFSTLAITILTATFLFSINDYHRNKSNKKVFDYTACMLIILTVVLIDIATPIFQLRVETMNVGNPHSLFVENEEGKAYRDFTFKVTYPLITLTNSTTKLQIGNVVSKAYWEKNVSYETGNLRVHYYPDGSSNYIVFVNTHPYFSSTKEEILTINLLTDFPISYQISKYNITEFEKNENISELFCGNGLRLNNLETQSIQFENNVSLFIFNNATVSEGNFKEYIEEYPNGLITLGEKCDSSLLIARSINLTKKSEGYEVLFKIDQTINASSSKYYYLRYYPYWNA